MWDLWEYEDVFQGIVNPPSGGKQSTHVAKAFFNKSVERGAESVGEHHAVATSLSFFS